MYNGKLLRPQYNSMIIAFFELITMLYFSHKLLPTVGILTPSSVYLVMCVVVFAVLLYAKNTLKSREFVFLLAAFAISFLTFIKYLINKNFTGAALYLYGEVQAFLYGWIALWYIKRASAKAMNIFLKFILICYVITAVTTYIGCTVYPSAARHMAGLSSSSPTYMLYKIRNIGNFSFIYELVLLLPILIFMIKRRKINAFLGYLMLAVIGFTVFKSEYMISIISFSVSLVVLLFRGFNAKKTLFILFLIFVIILLCRFALVGLIEGLSMAVESDIISTRIGDLGKLLDGNFDDISLSGRTRMRFYSYSLQAFVKSYGLGGWGSIRVGGHSFILDTVGNYGIIGIIGLSAMYFAMYKLCIEPNRKKACYQYLCWIYIMAAFFALFNSKANYFVFISIIPLFAKVC